MDEKQTEAENTKAVQEADPYKRGILERMEATGSLVRTCGSCTEFYRAPNPINHMGPTHAPRRGCQGSGAPHCTCDRCF